MDTNALIEALAKSAGEVPRQAEILTIQQHSLDDLDNAVRRLIETTGKLYELGFERGDWRRLANRTLVRLPRGGRAVVHHASGAMKLVTGLAPMERLFHKIPDRRTLERQVSKVFDGVKLTQWIAQNESLALERIWQIKAAATDRQARVIEPVLCRVVGAYRHVVRGLPVLGAASVAVKVAGDGALDGLLVQVRRPAGEVIDRPAVLPPEAAAEAIVQQLAGLLGRAREPAAEKVEAQGMRFGYLSFSKRKAQRVLAPVYVASIAIDHPEQEAQAYLLAVPATQHTYLPLCHGGSEALPQPKRKAA